MQRCYKPRNLFLPNLTPGKNKMIRYIWCIWHERFCLPSYFACMSPNHERNGPLARYVKLWGAHAPGMLGTFSPPPRVNNPDMHHGTCVAHVPWCLPGLLTSGFLWSRWWGKLSRYSRRMHDPHFYISGKRPMWHAPFFHWVFGDLLHKTCPGYLLYSEVSLHRHKSPLVWESPSTHIDSDGIQIWTAARAEHAFTNINC